MTCMGADDKNTANFLCKIVLVYQAWYIGTMCRLEEGMKVSEFVKCVIIPVVSALFLSALFRPVCMENGECDYLKLWLFMGVPFGICRMFFWIIPKGYDIGGTVEILFINVLVGGVIGGIVLVWRLIAAVAYLVKTVIAVAEWTGRKLTGKPCKI